VYTAETVTGGGTTRLDTTIGYDAASRPTSIVHAVSGGATLASYTLSWNAARELTEEVSNDGTVNFGYNSTGQLTSVSGWRSENYSYDAVGNRTMSGYQTGTGNRLLSDGTYNYTYDDEGNLVTKTEIATGKKWEYTWDYRNRFTNVKEKNASGQILKESNFTYDPFDKLIIRSNDPDGPGPQPASVIKTVYDGVHPYADFNSNNTLTDRYLYGPAVDMILADLEADGDLFWQLTNHLGSVRDIANKFGSVVDHVKYASFGHIISESQPANGDRFKFTARELESALDDYFYRARWYDDDAGRFIGEDPIGFGAGDPNLFRYVRNAPTYLSDPAGTQPDWPEHWPDPSSGEWPEMGQPYYGFNSWEDYGAWQLSVFSSANVQWNPARTDSYCSKSWDWDAFFESIRNSYRSMYISLGAGMVDIYNLFTGNEIPTNYLYDEAYTIGPLSSTTGGYHKGVVASLSVSTVAVSGATVVGVYEWAALGNKHILQFTVLSSGNVFKVVSRPYRWGFRIDPAHHGKPWGHRHCWRW
jgi:RHS repeat-associated protein